MILVLILSGLLSADIYSPVAHWEFDETSGSTAYDSADSHNGTVTGATWTTGKIGNALNFQNTTDKVRIADESNLDPSNAFTVTAWLNATEFFGNGNQNGNPIICKWDNELIGQYHLTAYTGGNIAFRIADGTASDILTANNALSVNNWHHIAAEWDGAYLRLYVDGILGEEKTTNITSLYNKDYFQDYINIGYDAGGASPYWNFEGRIDDVRYYDYALNSSEVYQLYSIPEPATICLLGLGALSLIRRKK
jgi:hypothetical protein